MMADWRAASACKWRTFYCHIIRHLLSKLVKEIAYSKAALKALTRMPANTARTIRAKIEQYSRAPKSLANNVRILVGMDGVLRLRVGDWRVIFTETGEVVAIIRIAPRGGAYE